MTNLQKKKWKILFILIKLSAKVREIKKKIGWKEKKGSV